MSFVIIILSLINFLSAEEKSFEKVKVYASAQDLFQITRPLSSKIEAKKIEERSLFQAEDLWSQFSNMNTSSSTNRIRYIKIRGIGERSEYDTVPSNSVGVFYDHIDVSGLSGVLAIYDVEEVEVLKGPQTFMYGDSSLGGNVLFKSSTIGVKNQYKTWLEGGSQSRFTVGNKNSFQISDVASMKIGLQALTSDGYFHNDYYDKATSSRREVFANMGFAADLGKSTLRASSVFGNHNNGNDFWNTDGSYSVQSDRPGEDDQRTLGQSFEVSGPLAKNLKYIAIASHSASFLTNSYDEDWNNNDYWNNVSGWNKNYDYFKSYERQKYNSHAKFVLQSKIFDRTNLSYGVHAYQKREKSDIKSYKNGALRNPLESLFVSNKVAALVSLQHYFSKDLLLEFSNRFEKQYIDYEDSNGFKSDLINNMYAFQFHLNKQFKNQNLSFVIARGFKGAGFNPEIKLKPEQQSYDPEYAMNYEISYNYSRAWWDNKISLFYFDRRDHQITTSSQDDPSDPSNYTFFIDNAAKSHIYGLELSSDVQISPSLSLNLVYGFLRAEFRDYVLAGEDYKGRELAHSPRHTWSLALNWKVLRNLSWNLRASGRDAFNFSNSHDQRSNAYGILSSSLHYDINHKTSLSLWGRNLLGRRYSQRGFYFGNEPPAWTKTLYKQNAAPLEWGVKLSYVF